MKFEKRMQDELVSEWADSYVSYKRLKNIVERSQKQGEDLIHELLEAVRQELAKAEALFRVLLEELIDTYQRLSMTDEQTSAEQTDDENFISLRDSQKSNFPLPRSASTHSRTAPEIPITAAVDALPKDSTGERTPILLSRGVTAPRRTKFDQFLKFVVGKDRLRKMEQNQLRHQYLQWNMNAHKLIHFSVLNCEALRKTAKKFAKYRPNDRDCTMQIEAEIRTSVFQTMMPQLEKIISTCKHDFHEKFSENLEQFEDVVMASTEHWHAKWMFVLLAFGLFCISMGLPIFKEEQPAHHCFALFVLVVTMWITEAIPFFCTAMLIPLIAVPLGILQDPVTGAVADPVVASRVILGRVFDHVQILVLGGLTIAKAFARVHLEVVAATWLHSLAAHRPNLYFLGVMVIACGLCTFVSNVASPLLVLGVIHQTLWAFPVSSSAPKGILLGLAFSCNLGGMLSPIASPQNAVAMQVLAFHNISFPKWVLLAFPVVLITLIIAWGVIIYFWKPFEDVEYIPLHLPVHHSSKAPSKLELWLVLGTSAVTILLWCIPSDFVFGDTGIVALIPIVVFFGVGVLKKDDFNTLSWHLMFLLAGGNMLGVCARDARLLDIIVNTMRETLENQSAYVTLALVLFVVAVVTTFVSHTVAAMIMLPIIAKIGSFVPHSSVWYLNVSPELLVFCSVLMCSGAMAFPITSFPNVNSLLAEDEDGKPYLKAKDFLIPGTLVTLSFLVSLLTWMLPYTNLVM